MSIEETSVVDAIGVESQTGYLVLTISDHLSWDDEHEHLRLLEEKLNTYLRFVESGEILEAYPAARDRKAVIDIVTRVAMPSSALSFLDRARRVLASAGLECRTRLLMPSDRPRSTP